VQDEILRLQGQVEMVLSMAKAERNALTLEKKMLNAEEMINLFCCLLKIRSNSNAGRTII
jgi:K+-sensing histidine kinase KdpD